MNHTEKEIIRLALYVATIRKTCPVAAMLTERAIFAEIENNLPESIVRYVMELTEVRIFN